jgi:uncharacterized protein YciI
MKHFLVYLDFGADYHAKRGDLTPLHMDYLKQTAASGALVLGGATMENGEVQGVYLVKAASKEDAEAFAKADPYFKIANTCRVVEWITVAGEGATVKL